jgi:hypothetical protein
MEEGLAVSIFQQWHYSETTIPYDIILADLASYYLIKLA